VEDQEKIAGFVRQALEEQGFVVELVDNGDDAYLLSQQEQYDVIVLDIMLPGRDGLSILRSLRERQNPVPVILLTARTGLGERLEGLNLGADDYVTKPFYAEELIARIHAVTRRAAGHQQSILRVDDLTINLITREVRTGDALVELTAREFSLLEYLIRSPGRVFPRTQILDHVWGYSFDPSSNVVDVYVRRLRQKLDPTGERQLIEAVRGVGYRVRMMPKGATSQ
jgi:DNA-binding response OmpR family regulator